MKPTTAILVLAGAVMAAPTNTNNDECNNKNDYSNAVCCNVGGLLGGLFCSLNILGNSCSGSSYCCKSAPQNGLINIGLECIKLF